MAHCPFDFFSDGNKHNICLVGGGGKTTVMYELATAWAACGTMMETIPFAWPRTPTDTFLKTTGRGCFT